MKTISLLPLQSKQPTLPLTFPSLMSGQLDHRPGLVLGLRLGLSLKLATGLELRMGLRLASAEKRG